MSLLMEALRKAEEAKQNARAQPQDPSQATRGNPDIAPEPVLTAAPEAASQPGAPKSRQHLEAFRSSARRKTGRASVEELKSYLETTQDVDETNAHQRSNAPAKNTADPAGQRAANAVFAAKQTSHREHTSRNLLMLLLGLIIAGGGGALWYLNELGNTSIILDTNLIANTGEARVLSDELYAQSARQPAGDTRPAVQPTLPDLPGGPALPAETAPASPPPVIVEQAVVAVPNDTPETLPGSDNANLFLPVTGVTASQPPLETASAATVTAAVTGLPQGESSATSNRTVLEVSHSSGGSTRNQQLLDAYASLQAGDIDKAATQYRDALGQLPNNRDALLGNAAIAMRRGNLAEASAFYSLLIQLNPKDPLARAGLLQTLQTLDQAQYEQELRRLIQQYPNVAPLSFALGNVYASQQRWNEAQAAYFDALLFARQDGSGATSPDYAYNLAVSLEQLKQPQAALNYYQQARELAMEVSPGFDSQELNRRIAILERD